MWCCVRVWVGVLADCDILADSMFSLPILEDQLAHYVNGSSAEAFATPFDFANVPVVTREQSLAEDRTKKLTTATPTLKAPTLAPQKNPAQSQQVEAASSQKYAQQLQAIPELREYGPLLKSSGVVELTESETEYVVSAVKHLFKGHVVLQFDVRNTLSDYVLGDLSVACTATATGDDEGEASALEDEWVIPVPLLRPEETGTVYCSFARPEGAFTSASFANLLKFNMLEIDPSTGEPEQGGGYESDYQVEDLELSGADYVLPAFAGSFDNIWSGLESAGADEAEQTLQLSAAKSLQEATEMLVKSLGMQPLEGSEVVLQTSTHSLRLFGRSVTGGKVAGSVRMAFSAKSGVTVKVVCRSEEEGLAGLVVGGVA